MAGRPTVMLGPHQDCETLLSVRIHFSLTTVDSFSLGNTVLAPVIFSANFICRSIGGVTLHYVQDWHLTQKPRNAIITNLLRELSPILLTFQSHRSSDSCKLVSFTLQSPPKSHFQACHCDIGHCAPDPLALSASLPAGINIYFL